MAADDPFRLLLMCTANQCRSPMAQAVAGRLLFMRGVRSEVGSCGTLEGGMPATSGARRVAARGGLDLSGHVSRRVTAEILEPADLVLTMERRHLVAAADVDPAVVPRAFVLKELEELSSIVGPRAPHRSVSDWIAEAAALRAPATVLTLDRRHDVPDPMGRSRREHQRVFDQIERSLSQILSMLFPDVASSWSELR